MDFTLQPPPLCPPRRAGGARTPPARPLRITLNPACVSRPAATAADGPSTSPAAADRTPPARALRVSLNPACVSRPSTAAVAAAKKPKRPVSDRDEDPATTKGSTAAGDGKENKIAPTGTAPKIRIVLRPSSRVGEAPTLPIGNTTTRPRGTVGASAAPVPAAKLKATPADSEPAVLRPCTSRRDAAPTLPIGNTTTRTRGTAADGHAGASAASAPAAKRKATPSDSELAVLRPCRRVDAASRSPLGSTARLHVGAADGHAAPAPAAKRTVMPPGSEQAKRRASPATATASAASASPSPGTPETGGTVRALLETARTATDAIRRREIERLRLQARRELDRVVRTVEFNDPFISPQDVLR
ncbi:hypothetical protein EJB05_24003, partial [Eragrostis curvula]